MTQGGGHDRGGLYAYHRGGPRETITEGADMTQGGVNH